MKIKYIEQQAAIKAVCDACGVIPDGEKDTCPYKYKGAGCREYDKIIDIPPADVWPVVLCKDCDFWNEWDSSGRESLGTYRCSCAEWTTEITTYYTGPDEFCSRGVKRDSDG